MFQTNLASWFSDHAFLSEFLQQKHPKQGQPNKQTTSHNQGAAKSCLRSVPKGVQLALTQHHFCSAHLRFPFDTSVFHRTTSRLKPLNGNRLVSVALGHPKIGSKSSAALTQFHPFDCGAHRKSCVPGHRWSACEGSGPSMPPLPAEMHGACARIDKRERQRKPDTSARQKV